MFLNAYAGICKFGKVRKTEKTLADFSKKSKGLKKRKKRKKKKFTTSLLHYFLKDMLRIVKGFALWILFDGFEEKFLYLLECREVSLGS